MLGRKLQFLSVYLLGSTSSFKTRVCGRVFDMVLLLSFK